MPGNPIKFYFSAVSVAASRVLRDNGIQLLIHITQSYLGDWLSVNDFEGIYQWDSLEELQATSAAGSFNT